MPVSKSYREQLNKARATMTSFENWVNDRTTNENQG